MQRLKIVADGKTLAHVEIGRLRVKMRLPDAKEWQVSFSQSLNDDVLMGGVHGPAMYLLGLSAVQEWPMSAHYEPEETDGH